MEIIVADTADHLDALAADRVADYIRAHPGRLLCLAAGQTPLGMMRVLLDRHRRGEIDLGAMRYAGLDDWLGLGYADAGSCAQFLRDNFYHPAGMPADRFRLFDGLTEAPEAECREMEAWIAAHGGLGLSVLGIGLNGHVGFNEPEHLVRHGPSRGCLVVDLDETTRRVSQKYFAKPLPVARGLTIGFAELAASDRILLLAGGAAKADIARRAFAENATPAVPASLLRTHPRFTVLLDPAAAAGWHGPSNTV